MLLSRELDSSFLHNKYPAAVIIIRATLEYSRIFLSLIMLGKRVFMVVAIPITSSVSVLRKFPTPPVGNNAESLKDFGSNNQKLIF